MKKVDKINLTLSLGGFALGIWAITMSYKAINSSESIAERSGAFDRAHISMGFGGLPISNSSNDTINVVYGATFEKRAVNLSKLPFLLISDGQKDAENIKVVIEYNALSQIAFKDSTALHYQLPPINEFKRKVVTHSESDLVTYEIDRMNPGVKFSILEPFVLRETEIITTVNENSSNQASIKVRYSNLISATLLGKDQKTVGHTFSVSCVNATDIKELVNEYVQKIRRVKGGRFSSFFIIPEKKRLYHSEDAIINEYVIQKDSVYYAVIQDTTPEQPMVLGLYIDGELKNLWSYDSDNKFQEAVK
jgi:hypothetical protein